MRLHYVNLCNIWQITKAIDIAFCQAHLIVAHALAATYSDCGGLNLKMLKIKKHIEAFIFDSFHYIPPSGVSVFVDMASGIIPMSGNFKVQR